MNASERVPTAYTEIALLRCEGALDTADTLLTSDVRHFIPEYKRNQNMLVASFENLFDEDTGNARDRNTSHLQRATGALSLQNSLLRRPAEKSYGAAIEQWRQDLADLRDRLRRAPTMPDVNVFYRPGDREPNPYHRAGQMVSIAQDTRIKRNLVRASVTTAVLGGTIAIPVAYLAACANVTAKERAAYVKTATANAYVQQREKFVYSSFVDRKPAGKVAEESISFQIMVPGIAFKYHALPENLLADIYEAALQAGKRAEASSRYFQTSFMSVRTTMVPKGSHGLQFAMQQQIERGILPSISGLPEQERTDVQARLDAIKVPTECPWTDAFVMLMPMLMMWLYVRRALANAPINPARPV